MDKFDMWNRIPDYMDRFTGTQSDKYSDLKLNCDLMFTDSCGKVYSGDEFKVPAAVKGTWKITITNEGKTLKKDSRISLFLYNGSFAHEMQQTNFKGKDYITMETTGSAQFKLYERIPGFSKVCRMYLIKGAFKFGDTVIITIGDTTKGGPGSNTYWTAGKSYLFVEAANSSSEMLPVEGVPVVFEVIPREDRAFLRILGPTVAELGERQRIHIGVFDNCGNLLNDFGKTIVFEGKEYEMSGGLGILEGVVFKREKVYRLEGKIKGEKNIYYSNPINVKRKPSYFIYWGDLHAHGWGDASMHLMHVNNKKTSPLGRHEQARDIGRMDFAAPGPMSYPKVDRQEIWDEYKDACRRTDDPGKYVPFLSYEAHPTPEGDRNVIFKSLGENIPPDYRLPMNDLEEKYGKRDDVFLEVHIGGRIPRWCDYMPSRERMVEAVSAFGNAEWLLQEALDRGFKPAVCGCSDLHYGLMGGPRTIEESRGRFFKYLNKRDSAYGTGPVTAVMAGSLERDSIWEAFEKRHTYATTDQRIYLEFSVNGAVYGDEIPETSEYRINLEYLGTDSIEEIHLISGKYIVRTFKPGEQDYKISITLKAEELSGDFIYLKASQRDGAFLICSPVYIKRRQAVWNAGSVYSHDRKEAARYTKDLIKYLSTEEDITQFKDIEPIGIIDEKLTRCALFHCKLGSRDASLRWYFEYEIPRFRIDWGHINSGVQNCEMTYKL